MWAALKLFLGGIPTWVFVAGGVAAGTLGVVWGVYHAGEAKAASQASAALAKANMEALQDEQTARVKAEAAFKQATDNEVAAQIQLQRLKDEIAKTAHGSASPGCRAAIAGVLQRAAVPKPGTVVPGGKK